MANNDRLEEIKLALSTNPDEALKDIKKFYTGFKKRHEDTEKSFKKFDNEVAAFFKRFRNFSRAEGDVKEMKVQFEALQASIKATDDVLAEMEKRAKTESGEVQKQTKEQIKLIKEATRYKQKQLSELKETIQGGDELFDFAGFKESAERAGQAMARPLEEFAQRDAPALLGRAMKLAMKPANLVGSLGVALGGAMAKKGQQLKEGGHAKTGEVMKGFGEGLANVLKIVDSMGPILKLGGAFMGSFIKIMFDAEAKAKEFNKQLLATAGTSEYLQGAFGDADQAAADLKDTLREARDGAMDVSNVMWGISKDTAVGFQSSLTAEGVSLKRLGKELDNATGYATSHAKVIQMGVAYSRAFGVSLNEISQLQGQMLADMGMGLDSVQASFQSISEGAADAGMASNKFFSIISSFSADMSLFANRMSDVTTLMGKLGKAMDPRTAQKFMQTITGMYTGDVTDNLKHVMIAGQGKVRGIATRDLEQKKTGLRTDIAGALGKGAENDVAELIKVIENPNRDPKAIAKWISDQEAKRGEKLNGPVVDAIQDLTNMTDKLASGNAVDLAAIMDQLSPLSKIEAKNEEAKSIFRTELKSLHGDQLIAASAALGVSQQELREFQKFGLAIQTSQQELLERLRSGNITEEDQLQLDKMGVKYSVAAQGDTADKLDAIRKQNAAAADDLEKQFGTSAGDTKYYNSMAKDQQALLKGSSKEISAVEKQANLQQSTLEQLEVIADILMNQIFDVMTDIWDAMTKMFSHWWSGGESDKARDYRQVKLAAARSKDSSIQKIVAAHGNDAEGAKKDVAHTVGVKAMEKVKAALDKYEELQKRLNDPAAADSKATQDKIKNNLAALQPLVDKYKGKELTEEALTRGKEKAEQITDPETGAVVGTRTSTEEKSGGQVIREIAQMNKDLSYVVLQELPDAIKRAGAPTGQKPVAGAAPAGAGAVPAGATAAVTPTAAAVAPVRTAKPDEVQKPVVESQQATTNSVEQVNRNIQTGVKAAEELRDKMANSVYEGAAKALFEYYMYSGMDRQKVARGLSLGGDPRALRQTVTSGEFPDVALAKWLDAQKSQPVQAHAMGGIVTGITGNLAQTKRLPPAAPGEGWASVGKGERILPAGGGGGGSAVKVELSLRGDLKQFIDARVVDGAVKHERNKRMR